MTDIKKAFRKTRKFARKLLEGQGIACAGTPTKNIVLCNAGQATGMRKEDLYELLQTRQPHLALPKYVPVKGESYAFLIFDSTECARQIYEMCHAKLKLIENGPPLYMIYVDTVPDHSQSFSEPNPPGLTVIDNFISDEEEKALYELFDWNDHSEVKGQLKNRQVKHFGYEFRYGSNDVDLTSPLNSKVPKECNFLLERLKLYNIHLPTMPDQLTVNKYKSGQGIPSHVDKHSPFGSRILSLSLGAPVLMDWRHHSGRYIPVPVPNKSMLVMEGDARYDWQHGIQARTWDPRVDFESRTSESGSAERIKVLTDEQLARGTRISLTFHWTRSGPCECVYPALCDSRAEDRSLLKDGVAAKLEQLHVHEVYERIASHFSTTRHKRWPRVEQFASSIPAGSILLDLGSGNGKNILRRNDVLQVGNTRHVRNINQLAAERSWGLLQECRSHTRYIPAADCIRADLLTTPCRAACADAVICIAVIHHFSNQERRIKAISEIARVLRPGGTALITVWARDQTQANYLCKAKEGDNSNQTDATMTVAGVNLPVHENRTQFQHNDVLVPWKLRGKDPATQSLQGTEDTLMRYYHVFDEGEMEKLCGSVPGLNVMENFYEQGNWCVVCRKVSTDQ